MNTSNSEKGFTLIEILIALAMAVFGLLAILSLIMGSLKTQQQSEFRRNAVTISGIIADKMRANTEFASHYDSFTYFDEATGATVTKMTRDNLGTPQAIIDAVGQWYGAGSYHAPCDNQVAMDNCSNDQVVRNDMIFWQSTIRDMLPDGVGMVRRVSFRRNNQDVRTQNLYQIMLMWYEKPSAAANIGAADLDPECTFPTVEQKERWNEDGAPKPAEAFRNYRCQVVTVTI